VRVGFVVFGVIAAMLLVVPPGESAAAEPTLYRLAEERAETQEAPPRKLTKLAVIAITDHRDVRNRFEDKFVSHLRGREVAAMASHSFVPDLRQIEDREAMLRFVAAEGVDGAITVRAVPLEKKEDEPRWAAAWQEGPTKQPTIRTLIEQTVPVASKPAKHYGIEIVLWESPARRVWSARTDVYSRKELQASVADLLQLVIYRLTDAGRL
jgi:hypothetical protein